MGDTFSNKFNKGFMSAENGFPKELVHPVYGAVWSDNGSMVKEENGKCRCELVQKLDLSDLIVKAQNILENLKSKYGSAEERSSRFLFGTLVVACC
jgi:hypothetical protein